MLKIYKPVFLCVLIAALFILNTCDDSLNPFSNNLGEKVVVEPPTVSVLDPVSGSYLNGVVTFNGIAKSYLETRKVEWYVYENEENGQKEILWSDTGIVLKGGVKEKTWTLKFDTSKFNGGKDGSIKMKFRVHDNKSVRESEELVYIIKNYPSEVKMTAPDSTKVIESFSVSRLGVGTDLLGQVIDRRGLRPGYPQIKFWPADLFPDNKEPGDYDLKWGYASLFLPGIGNDAAGYDNMQREGVDANKNPIPAGPGTYADRRIMPVVRAAQFSFHLAEYDIVVDSENPELRKIKYRFENGKHIPFESGKIYKFKIRTKDTASDPLNGMLPIDDPLQPPILGFFPPYDYGLPSENNFLPREEPVSVLLVSADTRPTIELNNDDISKQVLDKKPNIYITESTSKKIAVNKTGIKDFRLQVLATHPDGIQKATLEYWHESTNRFGTLNWDHPDAGVPYGNNGKLFTFNADGGLQVFSTSSEPYILTVNVYVGDIVTAARYTLYMDGEGPNVSIRSIRGAAAEPSGLAGDFTPAIPGFKKNKDYYTVNGNIQVVVDSTDNSGIMAFRSGANMGQPPLTGNNDIDEGRAMVKWAVELVDPASSDEPASSGTILQKLKDYQANPTAANLQFFNDIADEVPPVAPAFASGWVKRSNENSTISADKSNNFKLSTAGYDQKYLWLYVIAQDNVQNLGFIVQKLYVDDETDKPNYDVANHKSRPFTTTLYTANAKGDPIGDQYDLTVIVNNKDDKSTWDGNYNTTSPRKNILGKGQGIELNFFDDDGINLEDDDGVVIMLQDRDEYPPRPPVALTAAQKTLVLNAGNGKDRSGVLSQEVMAQALYGLSEDSTEILKDGTYMITISVNDDNREQAKVWINGKEPDKVPAEPETYYFVVHTEVPEIVITDPAENALGNDQSVVVRGYARSRLKIQKLWITFTPNIVTPPYSLLPSTPELLPLYPDADCKPGTVISKPGLADESPMLKPDADGYYTYYWQKTGVIFDPPAAAGWGVNTRKVIVEAYDRLGYQGNLIRTVQIDNKPPEVTLMDFNHGRPVDPKDPKVYVYGKVSFTVSASDENGLREDVEGNGLSGIKWWVFPTTGTGAKTPTWGNSLDNYTGTPYDKYGNWQAGYHFPLSMSRNGGSYTATIDTRKLIDGREYRLYILAMDKAGNQSEIKTGNCPVFTVKQSLDFPVVDKANLDPPENSIKGRAGLTIKGTAGDLDLFDSDKVSTAGSYVRIRFPINPNTPVSPPSDTGISWGAWIPISGIIDPSGDIAFTFNPDNYMTGTYSYAYAYFETDGTKCYQIEVKDEPVVGKGNYGKNPDITTADNPPASVLGGNPYVYEAHNAVTSTYPSPTTVYYFLIDNTPPVIYFDKYDPTQGHANYTNFRPTYSKWDDVLADVMDDLTGTVVEAHLSTLVISYGGESPRLIDNPPLKSSHNWDIRKKQSGVLQGGNLTLVTADIDSAVAARLKNAFDTAPQGPQTIIFEATDVAYLTHRVSWTFYKDTQGPDIIPVNISRAVKHPSLPAVPVPPAIGVFPSNWSETQPEKWQTAAGTEWTALRSTYGLLNWASDFAFYTDTAGSTNSRFKKIAEALKKEDDLAKTPSIVSGSPPVLRGQFSDALSYVWQVDSSGNYKKTSFWYRFRNKSGALQGNATPAGQTNTDYWIEREIKVITGKKNLAEWEIELNPAGGFLSTFQDGENQVDIKVKDSAGNESFIYGLVFLVDSADPKVGYYPTTPLTSTVQSNNTFADGSDKFIISGVSGVSGWTAKSLSEDARVFSADGVNNSTATAFTVTGRVIDYNLSNLKITIGQEGSNATPYTVIATVDIDPLSTALSNVLLPGSTGTGVVGAPDDLLYNDVPDTGNKRLTLAGPYNPGTTTAYNSTTEPPEWEWTLKILQKDIYGLRNGVPASIKDSTRRFINVIATDKARNKTPAVVWNFYLDTKKPVIEYNMDKGKDGSSFEKEFNLSGTVSDDTVIRDVQFTIARWNYTSSPQGWEWYYNGSWGTTVPTNTTWPSAFGTNTARAKTMSWTIDSNIIIAAGTKLPSNLFTTEGKYRLELYVTDNSIGNGNPNDTILVNDSTFSDVGGTSGRIFFYDTKDPTLKWTTLKTGTAPNEVIIFDADNQTYVRNRSGQVNFGFTAGDANTIQYWEAVVKDEAGNVVHRGGNLIDSSTGALPAAVGHINTTGTVNLGINFTSITDQVLSINPYMTTNGVNTNNGTPAGGTNLDQDSTVNPSGLPKTYTITLTVLDGAKRSSSITRQFILDNVPPVFKDFRPLSFPDSLETNTGKLNVKGNTDDNSNQLKRIAYYVVPAGPTGTESTSMNNPAEVPESNWKYYDANDPGKAKITLGGQTAVEIGEGTFAWELRIPQTSVFEKNKTSDLVQWTKTGGEPLKGPPSVAAGKYRDFVVSRPSFTLVSKNPTPLNVPALTFQDLMKLDEQDKTVYGDENVGLITVYLRAEDAAGNIAYEAFKYWIWPEGNRPQVTSINNPDSKKTKAERLFNGSIRLSGMATDNEQVKNVWFRVLPLTNGSVSGAPYTLKIPKWNDKWEPITNQFQDPVDDSKAPFTVSPGTVYDGYNGSRRTDDPINKSGAQTHTYTGGWYQANGGGARSVSWWAYINEYGELDPKSEADANEIRIEVRAQDVTWDDSKAAWMTYDETPATGYRGLASAMKEGVTWVDAWVVAGAPIFEQPPKVANGIPMPTPVNYAPDWQTIDTASIRGRSSYKVTVKHNSGLSALRWSPTAWNTTLNNGAGGFQSDSMFEPFNLLDLENGQYIYQTGKASNDGTVYRIGSSYVGTMSNPAPTSKATAFDALDKGNTLMTVTVDLGTRRKTGTGQSFTAGRNYLIYKWDPADIKLVSSGVFTPDSSYYVPGSWTGPTPSANNGTLKNLKNTVFTVTTNMTGKDIGNAIVIESEQETLTGTTRQVEYFKWDIIVDVRADLLTDALPGKPQSVRYPVYLSATEVSKATPITIRGDTLLPIDNKPPTGMYTLNRKPAGIAATIGGEAGDEGPVNGVARVVLWFQRGTDLISWHEKSRTDIVPPITGVPGPAPAYNTSSNPAWWNTVRSDNVIPASKATQPNLGAESAGSGGDWAIVIDRNSPSVGQPAWGHTLPMGFANGGMGKQWYVQLNTYGITSGPIDLHYVVIDKAGNAKYYKERLVIMNDAAVIKKINLATDIRDNGRLRQATTGWTANTRVGKSGGTYPAVPGGVEANGRNQILQKIWDEVPRGTTNVEKGITADIDSLAMGVDKIIDFNVRNNLFALRVETTAGPDSTKKRSFRLEYVSNAKLLENTAVAPVKAELPNMKAGRVYIINESGNARWGSIGAAGDGPWNPGYAFLAAVDGKDEDGNSRFVDAEGKALTGSVWELNSTYYNTQGDRNNVPPDLALGDVVYGANPSTANTDAVSAEFVYCSTAFGSTAGSKIIDTASATDAWTPTRGVDPTRGSGTGAGYSMFIIRVFDGDEIDQFGDFTIIRVRVNNTDKTTPFAQLYDINPKTEGQDRQNIVPKELVRSISPMSIGGNRAKGGLWNENTTTAATVAKSGHIEPRRIDNGAAANPRYTHSLTSAEMGGAATEDTASIQKPFANPAGFFATDTVSGKVVLRGYVEDNERIDHVALQIGNTPVFNILETQTHAPSGDGFGTPGIAESDNANYGPPLTGLLKVAANANATGKVYFTDSIDLYRHRVEWAYTWDTETLASTPVVGNITVRVLSYNRAGTANANTTKTHTNTSTITAAEYRPNTSPNNPGFPTGLSEYNSITMNLRPYITGFRRNQSAFAHNTRSRQGWYMFARNEQVVVSGFNLAGATGQTNITVGGVAANNIGDATGQAASHAITGVDDFTNTRRFRTFTVGTATTGVTGDGMVTLTVNNYAATNTRPATAPSGETTASLRPLNGARPYIQPWNIEYSPNKEGSELWDDFTQVHIWQSNDNTGDNGGRFASTNNYVILNPAMSIDPNNGTLYESHNEGGSGYTNNSGTARMTPITTTTVGSGTGISNDYVVMQFVDPIFFSDVYRSPGGGGNNGLAAATWVTSSIIGRSGQNQAWKDLGGIYVSGPGGTSHILAGGGNQANSADGNTFMSNIYNGEGTWYNASSNNGARVASPPTTDQFMNPHIVTSYTGTGNTTREHIHVSYFDDKDGSIKYRYNLRSAPGTIDGSSQNATWINTNISKMWTNLDGGADLEDTDSTVYTTQTVKELATNTTGGNTNLDANLRVVRFTTDPAGTKTARGNINAGKHNSIAVTSEGYPVIAYYDQTNQRLKMAVSRSTTPILASNWVIRDYVIPRNDLSSFGTGEFVSMKIDTRVTPNVVHIAAMNTSKRLVYVTGQLYPTRGTASTSAPYGGQQNDETAAANNVLVNVQVQVVDSIGNVGRWCSLSLDANGNPWISYMDESYLGARDGAKLAFLNKTTFYKGVNTGTVPTPDGYFPNKFTDINGEPIGGWETMHVPTLHRVENPVEGPGREHGRLGLECWPTRALPTVTNNRIWSAAVSYLSQDAEGTGQAMDRYRVAYYVK